MANLKEVRIRIASVISTQQITKAMKMVSASKLRRAQNAITQMRPYAEKQNQMLSNILSNLDGDGSTSFGNERDIQSAAIVVVTSNRGLCGGYNASVLRQTLAHIRGLKEKEIEYDCMGEEKSRNGSRGRGRRPLGGPRSRLRCADGGGVGARGEQRTERSDAGCKHGFVQRRSTRDAGTRVPQRMCRRGVILS